MLGSIGALRLSLGGCYFVILAPGFHGMRLVVGILLITNLRSI